MLSLLWPIIFRKFCTFNIGKYSLVTDVNCVLWIFYNPPPTYTECGMNFVSCLIKPKWANDPLTKMSNCCLISECSGFASNSMVQCLYISMVLDFSPHFNLYLCRVSLDLWYFDVYSNRQRNLTAFGLCWCLHFCGIYSKLPIFTLYLFRQLFIQPERDLNGANKSAVKILSFVSLLLTRTFARTHTIYNLSLGN